MKRKNYTIKLDGKLVHTKHAVKTSRKAVFDHVSFHMAGTSGQLTSNTWDKAGTSDIQTSTQVWTDNLGNVYTYLIERVQ